MTVQYGLAVGAGAGCGRLVLARKTEMARNPSEREGPEGASPRLESAVYHRPESHATIASISRRFLELPLAELRQGMQQGLASVAELIGAGRAYLLLLPGGDRRVVEVYAGSVCWGVDRSVTLLRSLPIANLGWSLDRLRAGRVVCVSDVTALPPEAETERWLCTELGIRSYSNIPLLVGKRLIGWLGFDAIAEARSWSRDELRLMSVAGEVFTGALERKRREERLCARKERVDATLCSLGNAVITTDIDGCVEYLNPIAEALTGWKTEQALGLQLDTVFKAVDEKTRKALPSPATRCLASGGIIGSTGNALLLSRAGLESAIEESAAPIRTPDGGVSGVVLTFHDVTKARRRAREVSQQAIRDPLTGLINRRELQQRLERVLASTRELGGRHALCYVDLDRFKVVNDSAGHAAGDALLKQLADLLAGRARSRDTVARLGGDEFILLLENCTLVKAHQMCESLVKALGDFRFRWGDRSFRIGASIGITEINARSDSVEALMAQADLACYIAKDQGRNQVRLYQTVDCNPASPRQIGVVCAADLRGALADNRFHLNYQPVQSLGSDDEAPIYHEILLRLLDNRGNMVLPKAFIPAATHYGMMRAIDRRVIGAVLEHYAEGLFADAGEARVAFNLADSSVYDSTLPGFIAARLRDAKMEADRVCFEIAAATAYLHLTETVRCVKALRNMGCRIVLDGFGSGAGDITRLRQLPLNYLKIEGDIVMNAATDPVSRGIVGSINEIAHLLGIETIAGRVESAEVLATMQSLGLDYAQGNLLAKPKSLMLAAAAEA
jgi:diguanylate cyclase (GGDEF)-like protein/PAS domain S-box-containing protein